MPETKIDKKKEDRGVSVTEASPKGASEVTENGKSATEAPRDGKSAAEAPRDGKSAAEAPRDGKSAAEAPRDGKSAAEVLPKSPALLPGASKNRLSSAQLRKIRIRNRTLIRAGVQAAFFLTMPGAFVAGFNGIKYIFRQISTGSLIEMNSFVRSLAGLAVFTIIFGRFFCGYACSFGTLGDLVYQISGLIQKKIMKRKKQVSIPRNLLPFLQIIKYFNLAFILVMTAEGWMELFTGASAWDVFSFLTAQRIPDKAYIAGIVCMAGILLGMAFQSRFFCQFLCPMGAFFAILPVLPPASLSGDPGNCLKGCSACRNRCPAGLKLEPDGIRNGECIGCECCTTVCPKNNISFPIMTVFKNEYIFILFRAALLFALGTWLGFNRFF